MCHAFPNSSGSNDIIAEVNVLQSTCTERGMQVAWELSRQFLHELNELTYCKSLMHADLT